MRVLEGGDLQIGVVSKTMVWDDQDEVYKYEVLLRYIDDGLEDHNVRKEFFYDELELDVDLDQDGLEDEQEQQGDDYIAVPQPSRKRSLELQDNDKHQQPAGR